MAEQRLVVDQVKLTYEGPFDLPGLYAMIENFFYDKGYDKKEKLNTEMVLPEGRSIDIELLPWKAITDYFKIIFRMRISGDEIKKTEIEKDGLKIPVDEGKIRIVIDGYILSDKNDIWKNSPMHWFIRVIFDKYFFKNHYEKAERWLISDIEDMMSKIKSFLNMYRVRAEREAYTEDMHYE